MRLYFNFSRNFDFEYFKVVVKEATLKALETIRSFQDRTSDSASLLEHALYLPDVSEETLIVVDCILKNCRRKEHLPVLLYYGPVFWRRASMGQEMDDVDRLTLIFRGASKFRPSLSTKHALAESLIARFFVRRNVEDIEESINIARSLLPHSKRLLQNALHAQAEFYLVKTFDAMEKTEDETDALRRRADCLEEIVLVSQTDDDDFSRKFRTLNQVKLVETLSHLTDKDHDNTRLDRAKLLFEDVWKQRNWIVSTPDMPHSIIVMAFGVTLVRFYDLTGGGSEYLQRLVELEDIAASVGTPEASMDLHVTVASAFWRRFRRFHALEDLRLSIHHWEHAVETTNNLVATPTPVTSAGINIVSGHLIDAYWHLTVVTHEHGQEVGTRCRDCAQSLHARIAQAPNGQHTDSDLLNAARGYLCHFFIGGPNNSESFDSLREAFSILSSKRFLNFPMERQTAEKFFDLVRQLAVTLEEFFAATLDFNYLESALLCHRSLMRHFTESGLSLRKYMNFQALARILFLRKVYLRSTPIPGAPEESTSAGISLGDAFGAISNVLGLGNDRARCHGRGARLLPGSLDARLTVRDEEDGDSEWFHLLVEDVSTQRGILTSGEHHCEYQSGHLLDLINVLASLALHSFHDKHREVSIAAFKEAISILHRIFITQPSVRSQRSILENGNLRVEDVLSLPSKAASYAISWNKVELAVEFLEHGRSLVWSRMRGLRMTETELDNVDEPLRTRFANSRGQSARFCRDSASILVAILVAILDPEDRDSARFCRIVPESRSIENQLRS